jgi:O-antigen/teichoic acid export membrane protein
VTEQSGIRRLLGGFAALGAATLVSQIVGFLVLAIAARRLGPEPIGSFSFALSLVGYFSIPANFGITVLGTRDLAREPSRAKALIGEVAAIQGALVLVPYVLVVALAPLLGADELSTELIPVVALTFVLDAASLQWVLYGRQRFTVLALARLAGSVVTLVWVLAFVGEREGDAGAMAFAWATVAGVAAFALVTLVVVIRSEGRPELVLQAMHLVRRFIAGVPFGLAAVMISIYYSIDSVMLGYLRSTEEVGQYAVAYKLPLAIIAIGALWASVLFPHASALAPRDPDLLRRQLGFFSSVAFVGAVPVGVGAVLVGGDLMPELFGPEFEPAGTPFIVLSWAAAVVLFTISSGTVALAAGEDRHYLVAVTAGAALNLLVNFAAIPLFGMTGAAAATVAAEVVVFAVVWRRLVVRLGPVPIQWPRIARALAATAVMAGVVVPIGDALSATARVAVGASVYAVVAVALGAVHRGEIRMALRPAG